MAQARKAKVFDPLVSPSKKDRVVATIREAIVSGTMKPGDAIVETRVARQLGVGQPLVREALLDLEHQGFVQRVPYKGTSVTRLGTAEIQQIQRLRLELESLAAEWAKARATDDDIEELRRLVDDMGSAARALDLGRFNQADLAFHRELWRLAGNPYLADALERMVVPLLTFFYLMSGRIEASHVASVAEHAAIVESLSSAALGPREVSRRALQNLKQQFEALSSPSSR
jgi:DNA-binding GntR family transcriptional regulator